MHSDHDDAECIRHVIPEPGSLSVPCLSVSDLFYYLVLLLHNLTLLAEMCVCVVETNKTQPGFEVVSPVW